MADATAVVNAAWSWVTPTNEERMIARHMQALPSAAAR